tara:strand:- start:277 stop:417 length:141 start_codon:yes stop_codon:yes gene_type:complete
MVDGVGLAAKIVEKDFGFAELTRIIALLAELQTSAVRSIQTLPGIL